MPGLNGTGPEGKGPGTGRRLGRCRKGDIIEGGGETQKFGKGLGKRRKSGGGTGKGKRLRYDE